ncbi:MAG: PA domain-containing protein [Gemmatimonadales bacterium]
MTAEPHPAVASQPRALAEEMADRFRSWGWDEVVIHTYQVLLPARSRVGRDDGPGAVSGVARGGRFEDPDTQDPASRGSRHVRLGDVDWILVYVNSGNPADYDWPIARGIDPRGKIALVRDSNPYSYRGFKALTAAERGLKAMLIYSDPRRICCRGPTFPGRPWGPESHIQRGSITYDFRAAGDPLTPGWASAAEAPASTPTPRCRSRT